MEQYIHTLIPVDSEFAPDSAKVASFFDELVSQFKFSPISRQHFLPGLVVAKPSGRLRWGTNPMTGEKVSVPDWDRSNLERFEEIRASIEGSEHYTVAIRPVDRKRPTSGSAYDGWCSLRGELCVHRSL